MALLFNTYINQNRGMTLPKEIWDSLCADFNWQATLNIEKPYRGEQYQLFIYATPDGSMRLIPVTEETSRPIEATKRQKEAGLGPVYMHSVNPKNRGLILPKYETIDLGHTPRGHRKRITRDFTLIYTPKQPVILCRKADKDQHFEHVSSTDAAFPAGKSPNPPSP